MSITSKNNATFELDGVSENINGLALKIGKGIGAMHDADIIHGDLTSSNMIVSELNDGEREITFIDFGLGMMKATIEDKAVDLYVLERAFISTHPDSESLVCLYFALMQY